jgi:hypothetical protein
MTILWKLCNETNTFFNEWEEIDELTIGLDYWFEHMSGNIAHVQQNKDDSASIYYPVRRG